MSGHGDKLRAVFAAEKPVGTDDSRSRAVCWQMYAAMDFKAITYGPKGFYTHGTVRLPATVKKASPACLK
jgi:hypothetical protein